MEPAVTGIPDGLRNWLEAPGVTDLCLDGHQRLRIDRGSGMEDAPGCLPFSSEPEYRQFILEQLSRSGRTWDAKLPFVDTVFFGSHRAHLVFPPIAPGGILLSLRKIGSRKEAPSAELRSQAERRWEGNPNAFGILRESFVRHETILLSGATGSGKTTLFNDLLLYADPGERIVALEDTEELRTAHPGFVNLLTRPPNPDGFGTVTLRDLVRQTLRMRPDRILIGECRGDEVLDLLLALNTGHRGCVTTLHANSAQDALRRLELLVGIASRGQLPLALIRPLIARGIRKFAHLERGPAGRRIVEILSLEGLENEGILFRRVYPGATDASVPGLRESRRGAAGEFPRFPG